MYIFFLPFVELALHVAFKTDSDINRSTFDVITGCFTTFSSITIASLILVHEYDFSLTLKDYLS